MERELQRLGAERCLPRLAIPCQLLASLRSRRLVSVHKGFVELTDLGTLVVLGLAARAAKCAAEAARLRCLRSDRTGGGPLRAVIGGRRYA
jgi:hypothetical protein